MNRTFSITSIICLGIMIGIGTGWEHTHHINRQLQTRLVTKQHQIDRTQRAIKNKNHQISIQFLNTAAHNPNSNISSVFLQNQDTQQVSRATSKFFTTYYSFNSSADYDNRKAILLKQGIITPSLAADRQIFNNDKIARGMNYVDIAQLNSQYISSYSFFPSINKRTSNLNYWTQVKFNSNYNDQKAATSTMIYHLNYNLRTHKITNVTSEASLFNNTETLSNLKEDDILDDY